MTEKKTKKPRVLNEGPQFAAALRAQLAHLTTTDKPLNGLKIKGNYSHFTLSNKDRWGPFQAAFLHYNPRSGEVMWRPTKHPKQRFEPYYDFDLYDLSEFIRKFREDMQLIRGAIDNCTEFFTAQRNLTRDA